MSVTPYLSVPDANAAIDFYVRGLGAVEKFRLPAQDGRKIMHAVLEVAGGAVFLSDMGPAAKPASVSIALGFDTPQALDAMVKRVAEAGATITLGPQDMFWGDRFAEVTDPFGHQWMFNAPKG